MTESSLLNIYPFWALSSLRVENDPLECDFSSFQASHEILWRSAAKFEIPFIFD